MIFSETYFHGLNSQTLITSSQVSGHKKTFKSCSVASFFCTKCKVHHLHLAAATAPLRLCFFTLFQHHRHFFQHHRLFPNNSTFMLFDHSSQSTSVIVLCLKCNGILMILRRAGKITTF